MGRPAGWMKELTGRSAMKSPGKPSHRRDTTMLSPKAFVDTIKTELIADRVWQTRSQLELAIVEYLGWFNDARLHESLGDLPPAEFEALYATQTQTPTTTIKI